MQETFKVKKAKITSDNFMHVETEVRIILGQKTFAAEDSRTCKWQPHQDLRDAFTALDTHLAAICEEHDMTGIKVTGFTIGGEDEHEGVTLIGQKRLAGNRVLNLVAPFTKYNAENNPYADCIALANAVEEACEEVIQYIHGKHAPDPQTSLFEDEPVVEEKRKQIGAPRKRLTAPQHTEDVEAEVV